MKIPNVADAQLGFLALQSKQTLLSAFARIFFNIEFFCALSTNDIWTIFNSNKKNRITNNQIGRGTKKENNFVTTDKPYFTYFGSRIEVNNLVRETSIYFIMEKANPNHEEENKSSSEDRIRWLRERGIQIHIPGEENVKDEHRIEFEFKVVKIPVDERLPFEEIYLKGFLGYPGDQCLELLKSKFTSEVNVKELDHDALKNLTAELGNDLSIKDSTLQKQLQEGGVEAFTLSHPSEANNFTRYNICLNYMFLTLMNE